MSALFDPSARNIARSIARLATIFLSVVGFGLIASGAWIPAKAVLAQHLLNRAFDRSHALHRAVKPWPWADMSPVARLSVPRLKQHRIVLDTGSGQALAFGPTIVAAGRVGGATIIAAHRDTHFRFLANVRSGDIIDLEEVNGRDRRFRVISAQIVRWDRFGIGADSAGSILALVTCYPLGAASRGPLRYVVRAIEVPVRQA